MVQNALNAGRSPGQICQHVLPHPALGRHASGRTCKAVGAHRFVPTLQPQEQGAWRVASAAAASAAGRAQGGAEGVTVDEGSQQAVASAVLRPRGEQRGSALPAGAGRAGQREDHVVGSNEAHSRACPEGYHSRFRHSKPATSTYWQVLPTLEGQPSTPPPTSSSNSSSCVSTGTSHGEVPQAGAIQYSLHRARARKRRQRSCAGGKAQQGGQGERGPWVLMAVSMSPKRSSRQGATRLLWVLTRPCLVCSVCKDNLPAHPANCYLQEAGWRGGALQTDDDAASASIDTSGCIGRQRLKERRATGSCQRALLVAQDHWQAGCGVAARPSNEWQRRWRITCVGSPRSIGVRLLDRHATLKLFKRSKAC